MQALIPTGSPVVMVELGDVPEPEPRDDELVIGVAAFSVNRGETFLLERPEPGWRPGKDVAGVVVHAARTGVGPKVGERVVAHAESAGWAARVAVAVEKVATLPAQVSMQTAAALPLAGLTALPLLRVCGSLSSRRVLLTGASGGVGHYFVELVAAQGAAVTAVTASAQRGARLRELGATNVISHVADANGRFDIGLDSVGAQSTPAVLRKLTDDGLLVWFGQASQTAPTLDFFDWSGGASATIRKFHYATSATSASKDLVTLTRLVAGERLHPEIGLCRNWRHTAEVIAALLDRRVRGNAILTTDT